jgi:glycolate oxidase FAD binding subunit
MASALIPTCEADVVAAIAEAAAGAQRLAIVSGASKADVGAPTSASPLVLAALDGVVDYDPAELVLTVRPGTRLADVEAMLFAERQMLAFEPFDHGPLFGRPPGAATIGGVVASGTAGSRRLSAGGARDHLLGLRAVSGRGQSFVAGAKVVKNVTGYDLPKLAAGSWGRLFALTELTLKVLPRPEVARTLAVSGLSAAQAVALMSRAMGSQADVAAAAHRPECGGLPALTCLRVEGFAPSVAARSEMIKAMVAPREATELDEAAADRVWSDLRTLASLGAEAALWRVHVPPSAGAGLVDTLAAEGGRWLLDWAGGLAWIAFDGDPSRVRDLAGAAGGHAMLMRGPAALRRAVPALHPQAPGLAALEERVRRAFDPAGVFETGRF